MPPGDPLLFDTHLELPPASPSALSLIWTDLLYPGPGSPHLRPATDLRCAWCPRHQCPGLLSSLRAIEGLCLAHSWAHRSFLNAWMDSEAFCGEPELMNLARGMVGHASGLGGSVHRAGGGGGFVDSYWRRRGAPAPPRGLRGLAHTCDVISRLRPSGQEDSDGVVGMRLMASAWKQAPSLGKVRMGGRRLQAGGQFLGSLERF